MYKVPSDALGVSVYAGITPWNKVLFFTVC